MAWAGSAKASGPSNFRGCDLTARKPSRHGRCPGALQFAAANGVTWGTHVVRLAKPIPGNRTNPNSQAAPACATESRKFRRLGAAPRRPANHSWGRGRQVMRLPCKQVNEGALPFGSTISLRGTRLKHRAKSHKLRQAGVIPAPATNINVGSDPARGL